MLIGREAGRRHRAPDLAGAGSSEPVLGCLENGSGGARGLRMHHPREPRHRTAPFIGHLAIEFDAAIGIGNLVYRSLDLGEIAEVFTHEVVGRLTPVRHAGGQGLIPEQDRQHGEIVGQHGAADDAGIAVGEVSGGNGDARPLTGTDRRVEQAIGRWIGMALQVAANQTGIVAQPGWFPCMG